MTSGRGTSASSHTGDRAPVVVFAPELYRGGMTRSVINSISIMQRYTQVHALAYEDVPVAETFPASVPVERLGIPLQVGFGSSPIARTRRRIARTAGLPVVAMRAARYLRAHRPHLLITHSAVLNLLGLRLRRWADNVVIVDHASEPYLFPSPMLDRLGRRAYPKADGAVAISSVLARSYRAMGIAPETIHHIPNAIDVESIQKSAVMPHPSNPFGDARPYFLNVGRLHPQKGQHHLLRAFAHVRAELGNVGLVIVGFGAIERRIRHLVSELGLDDAVRLTGWVENPFPLVAGSLGVVSTSLWEGLPLADLETLACGTPLVASATDSGRWEILGPGRATDPPASGAVHTDYGILTPVPDGHWRDAHAPLSPAERATADAMRELHSDRALRDRLGAKGRDRAKEFDLDSMADRWLRLLQDYDVPLRTN